LFVKETKAAFTGSTEIKGRKVICLRWYTGMREAELDLLGEFQL
jgi:hypothetical protein